MKLIRRDSFLRLSFTRNMYVSGGDRARLAMPVGRAKASMLDRCIRYVTNALESVDGRSAR